MLWHEGWLAWCHSLVGVVNSSFASWELMKEIV
jgi:hypothetical protein